MLNLEVPYPFTPANTPLGHCPSPLEQWPPQLANRVRHSLVPGAVELWSCGAVLLVDRPAPLLPPPPPPLGSSDLSSPTPKLLATRRSSRRRADGLPPRLKEDSNIDMREWRTLTRQPVV